MKRSIKEQADYMLQQMTVDMIIDFGQSQQCAIAACDLIIDEIREYGNPEIITASVIYWEKVKKELDQYKR